MTIYLTKAINEKVEHFRAAVIEHIVSVVHGVFYEWQDRYAEGCIDAVSAVARQKELVDEKIREGFLIEEFNEIPENTVDVYDKAKWHFGGNFPEELDISQAYVHTGLFLGWIIDTDLLSEEYKAELAEEIEQFKQRQLTGPQLFERLDGILMLEHINEMGNRFALLYFGYNARQYLNDYEAALGSNYPSLYHVPDTWQNYDIVKRFLDMRFSHWKASAYKKGR